MLFTKPIKDLHLSPEPTKINVEKSSQGAGGRRWLWGAAGQDGASSSPETSGHHPVESASADTPATFAGAVSKRFYVI